MIRSATGRLASNVSKLIGSISATKSVLAPQEVFSSPSLGVIEPTAGCTVTHPHPFSSSQSYPSFPGSGAQWRGMFIQTRPTPNPSSMMFVPGKTVMESGTFEFPNARAGMASPLATRLFTIDGIETVFFGSDFVTVTKAEDQQWALLKPQIFAAIMDHFSSGEPLFKDADTLAHSDTAIHPDDDEVVAMIKELLETRIRPAVQDDGGDIVYKGYDADTGTVTLKMMGACSGCPSSSVTLKSGIENMLMHYIPEVKQVVQADPDEGEQEALEEFDKLESKIQEQESAPKAHLERHLSS